ncbi:MAG: SPOR domain-containing protein [Phycisphaerales bacterium]|nr:SPOR domain-containing protein [Phycisphaerales bacterium]
MDTRAAGWMCGVSAVMAVCSATVQPGDGEKLLPPPKPRPAPTAPAKPPPVELRPIGKQTGAWSIVLAAFRGEPATQRENAAAMLEHIAGQKELAGAFTEQRGGGKSTVVAVGRFADPSSEEAQARLNRVRAIAVDGKKPYAGAFLAPPGELTNLGQRPEFNLVRDKEQFGERAAYSLQVAAFGRMDILDGQRRNPTEDELKEARRTAEEAAATLRQEGELAFFYHGPRYSSVTIGVWDDADFGRKGDPQTGEPARPENPDLAALRKRFPNNLYNGAGVKVKTKAGDEQLQPSVMVRIPER